VAEIYDVIVIGGGAIGAATARELALAGGRILLLERGTHAGQAWSAAAGMLAPQIEADADDQLLRLSLAARDYYRRMVPQLEADTGIGVDLWVEGIARIAEDESEAETLMARVRWQQQQGYDSEWLGSEEVHRRWPWLGRAAGALWAHGDGALDPRQLVRALRADAVHRGATQIEDQVTALRLHEKTDRVMGVVGQAGRYHAPQVVVAAGAWSGLIEGLPRRLPVEPVRGQMLAVPWPSGVPRAIAYHKDCYLLARAEEAVLGSTMEYAGFRPEVTPDGIARIMAAGVALCPALSNAEIRRSWAGLRPVTEDGLPIIGGDSHVAGLWYAMGHGRNGILLAGLTGVLMRQIIEGREPDWDLRGFSPDRFESRPLSRAQD
jgi:glycine oxidase